MPSAAVSGTVKPAVATPRRMAMTKATTVGALLTALAASTVLVIRTLQEPAVTEETLNARPGSRLSATLADGSHVELRGGSSIRVRMPTQKRWWRKWLTMETLTAQRLVELSGEAKFEVVHDARHPFRVVARNVAVDDIGTVFGVRAYAGDSAVRVLVTEGEVMVHADARRTAEGVSLVPGSVAVVGASGAMRVTRTDSIAPLLSWTDDRLVFRDTPLSEVIHELEITFGRPIRLSAPVVNDQPITITLDGRRLDTALRSLGVLLNLSPQSVGDTLVLSTRPTSH